MEDVRIPLPPSPPKFLDQFRVFIRTDGNSQSLSKQSIPMLKSFERATDLIAALILFLGLAYSPP